MRTAFHAAVAVVEVVPIGKASRRGGGDGEWTGGDGMGKGVLEGMASSGECDEADDAWL